MRLARAEPKNRPVKIAGPNLLVSKLAEHCNMNCIGSVVVFFIRHLIIRVIYIYMYICQGLLLLIGCKFQEMFGSIH